MAAPKGGTRERLLDAAEKLFAEKGFEGTSTRDIAALSGDTIGSVSYHFGSKDELHVAVIRRRHAEIHQDRNLMLEHRIESDETPALEEVVAYLIIPYLQRAMKGEPGWRNYLRMMSRIIYSPKWYPEVVADLYDPPSRRFIQWICKSIPGTAPKDVGYAYHFVLGVMIHCSADIASNRIGNLTDGLCDASDFDEIRERVVRFCAAGVRGVTGAQTGSSEGHTKAAARAVAKSIADPGNMIARA